MVGNSQSEFTVKIHTFIPRNSKSHFARVSMGISIEQYRSKIGSHDNFMKTKDILSRFKDLFWSLLFRMFY